MKMQGGALKTLVCCALLFEGAGFFHPDTICAFEEALRIPWGDHPGEVGNRWHPAGNFGPTDFVVEDSGTGSPEGLLLYILDTEHDEVEVYGLDDRNAVVRYPIPKQCRRFAVRGTEMVLWDGMSVYMMEAGESRYIQSSTSLPFRTVDHIAPEGEEFIIYDEAGRPFRIEKRGDLIFLADSSRGSWAPPVEKLGEGVFILRTRGQESIQVDLRRRLGSIDHIGSVGSIHCLAVEYMIADVPIRVRESLVFVSEDGDVLHEIALPSLYYTDFPNRIRLFDNRICVMVSSPGDLSLYSADIRRLIDKRGGFPVMRCPPYHFNEHLPRYGAVPYQPHRDLIVPISRDSVMAMARRYIDMEWIATEANITEGVERMPDGTYVRTPAWVRPGERRKVPYKWGGFTSIEDFAAGVSEGKKCGDDYLESMGHSDEYCIGVDCSGYVSRCWGVEEKYFTATMHEISHELSSCNFLRRGDAINKPHHHIRLVAEDLPSGMILTTEAGGDWRVSYKLCKLTGLTGYLPIRFDHIVEGITRDPFIIAVTPGDHEVSVRRGPSSREEQVTTIRSPMCFVSTAFHNGWYHFHMPSGTGVYGGWCFGGEEAGDAYMEGNQDGALLSIVGTTLNAYSGPDFGNTYVTTVSPGQRFSYFAEEAGWYGIYIANVPDDISGWIFGGSNGEQVEVIAGGPHDGYGAEVLTVEYPPILDEGEEGLCAVRLRNIGSCSWNESTRLRTTMPRGRFSILASSSWIDSSTITGMNHAVLPHQTYTISFSVRAPLVARDSLFIEHFGVMQNDFAWFGDTDQLGPADMDLSMDIHIRDIGLPASPILDTRSIGVRDGMFTFSWYPVSAASHYGIFRGLFGSGDSPQCIVITNALMFSDSAGIHQPRRNVYYRVKAFSPCDSSGLSRPAGEFEFAGGKRRRSAPASQ